MECEIVDPSQPLRQGDIVAAHPLSTDWRNPFRRFCVVLSADCDIAHGKTGPSLVCVPVLSHYSYVLYEWLPGRIDELRSKVEQRIDKQLEVAAGGKITTRNVLSWGDSGEEAIRSRLAAVIDDAPLRASSNEVADIVLDLWALHQRLNALAARLSTPPLDEPRKVIIDYMDMRDKVDGQVSDTTRRRSLVEGALSAAEARLDTSLIGELPGLDADMKDDVNFGYITLLREFLPLPLTVVETERTKWYKQKESYLRISRLTPKYKYDLVQKFANLFVRVGLDDYRNDIHRRTFKRCAESFFCAEGIDK